MQLATLSVVSSKISPVGKLQFKADSKLWGTKRMWWLKVEWKSVGTMNFWTIMTKTKVNKWALWRMNWSGKSVEQDFWKLLFLGTRALDCELVDIFYCGSTIKKFFYQNFKQTLMETLFWILLFHDSAYCHTRLRELDAIDSPTKISHLFKRLMKHKVQVASFYKVDNQWSGLMKTQNFRQASING